MKPNRKLDIVNWLLRKDEYLLFFAIKKNEKAFNGGVMSSANKKQLARVFVEIMEKDKKTRSILLAVVKDYCKRYEVDGRNFAKDILTKD